LTDRGDERGLREYARTTANSMELRDQLPFSAWLDIGQRVGRIANGSAWWLGDWVLYGEQAYGKRYKAALEVTHLDYQTLRNYAWVARAIEPRRRRAALSFQHHAEVAALPETDQDLWLSRAERDRWSRNELRRRLKAEGETITISTTDRPAVTLRLPVTTDRRELWRQAAAAAEQDLPEFIAAAADEAAEAVLSGPAGRVARIPA
jgi:Protein of unknown function (DUF1778)